MRRFVKVVGLLAGLLLLLSVAGVVHVELTWDRDWSHVPAPKVTASKDPAVIAQGAYVVHALAHCSACHQPAEFAKDRRLSPDETDLAGGYTVEAGPFGTYTPANLTPDPETGLGLVSDPLVARMVRHGIDRHGKYSASMAMSVGNLSDEDLTAVVSYLRSLPPRKRTIPPPQPSFLSRALTGLFRIHDEPPLAHVPAGGTSVERGAYIANGPAFCYGCHTDLDLSTFQPTGQRFSGMTMAEPDPTDGAFEFVTPNLTPDPETGAITAWSEEQFVARFKQGGRVFAGSKMPWENFAKMTEDDLRSVYRYLRTLPPTRKVTGPSRRPAGWKPS